MCEDPWWIIGSAAVALHGAAAGEVADIDVIVSPRDFAGLEAAGHLRPVHDRTRDHFNSAHFGRGSASGMEVEFFAELKVNSGGTWHLVSFEGAEIITCDGAAVRVPSKADLIGLLELFGREKDLQRAAALRDN